MGTRYNAIAGQSVERLAALSDGLFAVAMTLLVLFAISLMPFSTSLMAEFTTLRTALLLYWLNIVALGALLYAGWRYAMHAGLVEADVSAVIDRSVERRVYIAQALYTFGSNDHDRSCR